MIELLIQLGEVDEFKGKSEAIDIAKGKYKLPLSFKEAWVQFKRQRAWQ